MFKRLKIKYECLRYGHSNWKFTAVGYLNNNEEIMLNSSCRRCNKQLDTVTAILAPDSVIRFQDF